jgi:photosystem II stability/assembly factor-like uncharacterized protein
VTDERIERAVRDWLRDHAAGDAPASLQRHLDRLVEAGRGAAAAEGGPAGAVTGGRLLRPAGRRVSVAGASRARGPRAIRAIAAAVVVALVGGGLIYGLANRSTTPATSSPSPGASGAPRPSATAGLTGPVSVVDAALVDPDHGWALTAADLVRTDDGGATWQSILPADVAVSTIRAVRFADSRIGWLAWWSEADPRITIERTNDGGRTWSRSHTPGTHVDGVGRVSIQGFDNGHLFVQIETVHSSASCIGELDASDDAGISWLPDVAMPPDGLGFGCAPIRFRDPAHGWTTGGPLNQALEATADGGRTWTQVQPRNPRASGRNLVAYQAPAFAENGQGLDGVLLTWLFPPADPNSAGRSGQVTIDRTSDGGATWQPTTAPPDANLPFLGDVIPVAPLGATDWLVAGSSLGSRLWRTTDAGGSWTAIAAADLPSPIASLGFVDATTGWAIDLDGALHATADRGQTWRALSPVAATRTRPSATPSPAVGTGPFAWTLVSSEGDLATYDIVQAIHRRDGGAIGVAFGQEARTVHSDDGVIWVLDPADPGLLAAPVDHQTVVDGLADGPDGLVAVGASALFDFSTGLVRAWMSTDGLHWLAATRIDGDSNASMEAVVGGKSGYIAVGSDGFPGANTQLPGTRGAAVWRSPDGDRWLRAPGQAAFADAIMTGVATTPKGYVAWGENIPVSIAPNPVLPIWTSVDGVTWTRAASGRGQVSFAPIGRVVVLGDRWIAVGTGDVPGDAGGTTATAWTSRDEGRTWTAAPMEETSGARPSSYAFDVAMAGADLLAVGHIEGTSPASDEATAAVWKSIDQGATWTRLPSDPTFDNALMRRILPLDENRFVVFGAAYDPNALVEPNLIWLATSQP